MRDAADEFEELARIDEQLTLAAAQLSVSCRERARRADRAAEGFGRAGDPGASHVAGVRDGLSDIFARVGLPGSFSLLGGSLPALRTLIARLSKEGDPARWAACHLILGSALRLRCRCMPAHRRARAIIEATRAFDAAYLIYVTRKPSMSMAVESSAAAHPDADATHRWPAPAPDPHRHRRRPVDTCAGQFDGSHLVVRVIGAPFGTNGHLLERAVSWLRTARAGADIRSWEWMASSNNLACALTLLGNRTPTAAGGAMLGEATRVLREALQSHAAGHRREDRGSTLINLAETLLSMAERETPEMRLRRVERALTASSIALLSVVPPEYGWLVRVELSDIEH